MLKLEKYIDDRQYVVYLIHRQSSIYKPVEVILNRFAAEYLVKAIHEERLEEARGARLARSIAQGRRRDTPRRVSMRRAVARAWRHKAPPEALSSTNPAIDAQ